MTEPIPSSEPLFPVAILSSTQGDGFGAEAVLEEMLRGWDAEEPPLVIIAPASSRFARICAETQHHFIVLPTERDAIVNNVRATLALRRDLPNISRVHAWSARSFELAVALGRRLGVPASGTMHDHPCAAFMGKVRQSVARFSAARFDVLICVSEATRGACQASGYTCPLAVVHNGLHEFDITRKPNTGRLRLGFPGMRTPRKGFRLLESWMPELMQMDVDVLLYGDPHPDFSEIADAFAQAFPGRVLCRGQQPRAAIWGEMDVLLHLSTDFEPFATTLLEAGMAGLPCVASRCGGAGEAVIHEKTGFLFDVAQEQDGLAAVRRLAEDALLRSSLGAEARRRFLACFRVDHMCSAYASHWRNG
jgi:glycosyltransferase involved in cell wall biosynthesis